MLKYSSSLLAVTNMEQSIHFYEEVLGQRVTMDYGENVVFEGGFCLQENKLWSNFLHCPENEIAFGGKDAELYFTEENFEDFVNYLSTFEDIVYVHEVETMAWGQRVIRFFDPDKHIIEVGEDMDCVIKKMLAEGMSVEAVATKSQFPIEYIKQLIHK